MELFGRAIELLVGPSATPQRLTGLRASFTVTKTLDSKPNTLDLKIWNLSKTTRSLLQSEKTKIFLMAGYTGELSQIFVGSARTVDHTQEGADVVTRIQSGDGEVAGEARVSESYGPGSKVVDVVLGIAKTLGVDMGNLGEKLRAGGLRAGFDQFPHGYTAHGRSVDELDRLLTSAGLTWSIQDGVLQVLGKRETAKGEVILLNASTGLISSPAHGTAKGAEDVEGPTLKVKSLLRSTLNPGREIFVDSKNVRGVYRIEKVVQSGDTAGGEWYSEMEVKSVPSKQVVSPGVFGWRRWSNG